MKHVIIYTDGGCDPNPGRGGYGVVLLYGVHRKELSGGYRLTTNNRMEIIAVIKGLENLNEPCKITLHCDSQYVVRAMNEGWVTRWRSKGWMRNRKEPAKNVDLWKRLLPLLEKHDVEFVWVKAHVGIDENERCDQLVAEGRKQPNLSEDNGYKLEKISTSLFD